ncbi:glycosyltransferase [Rhodococcus sp. T9N]|jgi:glycosyltransferase involved in cell wall biosynthesis|uniref:glycosyltransferase n=1 Tax=Rhodococcus sp. T9N TaxID=627445 RepID=UPI0021C2ABC1|nr:glycosyltransferase [Rhodococcus sp. T9N]
MRPLRVALIASSRHPVGEPFPGGLEAHVWQLTRALKRDGHDVTLFAGPGSDPDLACGVIDVRPAPTSSAAREDISMPPERFMNEHHAYLDLMLRLSGELAGRFDLVHNHSLHYLPVAMAPMLPTPLLTTLHTPPTPWLESAMAASGQRGRFAAVSQHTANSWEHATGPLTVVHNGVDTECWSPGSGGDRLIWFGRIVPEKGAHQAIAAARIARMPLVLAGPISDHRYFSEMIEPHLDDTVRYLGHLPTSELSSAVGSSVAALVTPLWDEPYGLVVAEALACGTPVVAFEKGGIPEILTPACGRLVSAGDVEAMATAIVETIGLSRSDVRAHAVMHCSHRRMVDRYVELYRELVSTAQFFPMGAVQ